MTEAREIYVEAYCGYRSNERPLRFRPGERMLEVQKILRTWVEPDRDIFDVLADDARRYRLVWDRVQDRWYLL